MTSAEFERKLACHCAPALAGIKPANLFSVPRGQDLEVEKLVEHYRKIFGERGISFQILCRCSRQTLVMVYRPAALLKDLEREKSRELLKGFGYRIEEDKAMHLPELLSVLAGRIRERESCGFPHEIGLFLGYPIEDVTGFIENRGGNYLYSGYWKVYSDVQRAKTQFARYETVKAGMMRVMEKGKTLCDMFGVSKAA